MLFTCDGRRRRQGQGRRAGRGADRAAAPLRRRGPVRDLTAGHAAPGPPPEPAPRRPTVPVRAARGHEIPGHRHQHPHRPGPVPRSPPQNPGPGSSIRSAKDTGLRNFPLHGWAQNQIWAKIIAMASELLARMAMLALAVTARRWEPNSGSACCPPPGALPAVAGGCNWSPDGPGTTSSPPRSPGSSS